MILSYLLPVLRRRKFCWLLKARFFQLCTLRYIKTTYFSCWFQCTNVWYRHPAKVKFGISLHANCQISTCRQTNFAVFFFSGCYFFLFMQSVGAFPFSLEDNFSESSSNIYVMSYNSVFVLFRLTLGKVSVFSFFVVHFVTFRASVIPSWA